jgi:hypothetical protein
MLARIRFALWTVFVVSLVTAFWQYFEFAYKLAENGLITSPQCARGILWTLDQ